MDKREMSPFGRMLFDTFSAVTKAQSELIKAQQELGNSIILRAEEIERDNQLRRMNAETLGQDEVEKWRETRLKQGQ